MRDMADDPFEAINELVTLAADQQARPHDQAASDRYMIARNQVGLTFPGENVILQQGDGNSYLLLAEGQVFDQNLVDALVFTIARERAATPTAKESLT